MTKFSPFKIADGGHTGDRVAVLNITLGGVSGGTPSTS